jgi:hypothetical protein
MQRFGQKFSRKIRFQADSPRALCGWSVILFRSKQNNTQLGGPGGRSAAYPRTVRGVLADGPPGPTVFLPAVDFAFLPLEFKRGQSARASRTVRKVRVLPITTSNGKGEYKYFKPEVGEALLAL